MDTADSIARDLIDEVGRGNALWYLVREMIAVRSVGGLTQSSRLLLATTRSDQQSEAGLTVA